MLPQPDDQDRVPSSECPGSACTAAQPPQACPGTPRSQYPTIGQCRDMQKRNHQPHRWRFKTCEQDWVLGVGVSSTLRHKGLASFSISWSMAKIQESTKLQANGARGRGSKRRTARSHVGFSNAHRSLTQEQFVLQSAALIYGFRSLSHKSTPYAPDDFR